MPHRRARAKLDAPARSMPCSRDGLSLRAVDPNGGERDEYLSLSNRAVADLRKVVPRDLES
jgi:hypothetical protein